MNETIRPERAVSSLQAYPWTLLNRTTPHTVLFNSSGTYSSHLLRFSLSGIPRESDLVVLVDGEDIEWKPHTDIGMDRWHYDIFRNKSLLEGIHNFTFSLGESAAVGKAQLCNLEVIEYGSEAEFVYVHGYCISLLTIFRFNHSAGNIGAYPTQVSLQARQRI